MYCECYRVLGKIEALGYCLEEILEFMSYPSRDELSDIAFAVGRLLGAILHREYVHVPYEKRHVAKISERMATYGCIRSNPICERR